MRKETQPLKMICVICKLPIEPEQRPSVQLRPGDEAHLECWEKRDATTRKPN